MLGHLTGSKLADPLLARLHLYLMTRRALAAKVLKTFGDKPLRQHIPSHNPETDPGADQILVVVAATGDSAGTTRLPQPAEVSGKVRAGFWGRDRRGPVPDTSAAADPLPRHQCLRL